MTDHKATPEQWADAGAFASDTRACLLELRARVEALEHRFDTQRLAALEWGKDVDMVKRWSDQHLQRIMVLEAAQPKQITQEELAKLLAQPATVVSLATASAGSLVETPDELEKLLRLMNSGASVCHSEGYEELHDAICRGVDLLERLTQQQPEPIDEEENDRRLKACMAAIDAATPEQIRAAAGLPERSSLVERVSCAIDGRINPDQWLHQDAARAAIREVAAAARANDQKAPEMVLTWEGVVLWLEQEAKR